MFRFHAHCCRLTICLLALVFSGQGGSLSGAPKEQTASPEEADAELMRYFSRAEFLEWERAQDMIQEGKSTIENGRWLMNRQPSVFGRGNQEEVQSARRAGAERVAEGERQVKAGEKILADLRERARESKASIEAVSQPTDITLEIEQMELQAALNDALERLIEALEEQGRSERYLAGTFFWEAEGYLRFGQMDRKILEVLEGMETEHGVIAEDLRFTLGARNGQLIVDFPDRDRVLPSGKAALIVGELAFDSRERRALLAVRAIDPDNLLILASRLYALEMDTELKALLSGMLVVPQEESDETIEEQIPSSLEGLALFMHDSRNFIGRIKASEATDYVFVVGTNGAEQHFPTHQAVLLSVQMLKEHGLQVSDSRFASSVFLPSAENPPGLPGRASNAHWILVPESSRGEGRELLVVEASTRSLRENILVGELALADTLGEAKGLLKQTP